MRRHIDQTWVPPRAAEICRQDCSFSEQTLGTPGTDQSVLGEEGERNVPCKTSSVRSSFRFLIQIME